MLSDFVSAPGVSGFAASAVLSLVPLFLLSVVFEAEIHFSLVLLGSGFQLASMKIWLFFVYFLFEDADNFSLAFGASLPCSYLYSDSTTWSFLILDHNFGKEGELPSFERHFLVFDSDWSPATFEWFWYQKHVHPHIPSGCPTDSNLIFFGRCHHVYSGKLSDWLCPYTPLYLENRPSNFSYPAFDQSKFWVSPNSTFSECASCSRWIGFQIFAWILSKLGPGVDFADSRRASVVCNIDIKETFLAPALCTDILAQHYSLSDQSGSTDFSFLRCPALSAKTLPQPMAPWMEFVLFHFEEFASSSAHFQDFEIR